MASVNKTVVGIDPDSKKYGAAIELRGGGRKCRKYAELGQLIRCGAFNR